VLKDYRTAPIDDRMKAMLTFIEKMTLTSDALTKEDADAVRATGVDDEMLLDAAHVCAAFNMIDRVADTVEFAIPSAEDFRKAGKMLLSRGYR
jgi:alkylhydroperoxidase family enzyme